MLKRKRIPHITINRLSIYYRYLEKIVEAENKKDYYIISSSKIAEVTGINSSQIRKDLAYFGQFGKRGMGYR
jgi:redox-sensing transcriptional repressor